MADKIPRGVVSGRTLTPLGAVWLQRVKQLARSLLQLGGGLRHEVQDGYILRATRSGRYAVGTVIDTPQAIACPSGLRVPFAESTSVSGGLVFPVGMRDLWQAGYTPAPLNPKLPTPDITKWRLAANTGFSFDTPGADWVGAVSIQLSAMTARAIGYEQTTQLRDLINVAGFYNVANPSRQQFITRLWASSNSASRANTEANTGAIPIPNIHAASLSFSTSYVDARLSGWVTVPRAAVEFTPSSPPGWANPAGVWGRSYRIDRDGTGRVRYLVLARLFDTTVYGADDAPYFEPGAAWVATAEVTPTLGDGGFTHTGSVLSETTYQTIQPSRFRNPDSCNVAGGVHVLLHAEIVDNPSNPSAWAGGNTYTVVSARAPDPASALVVSYAPVDVLGDNRSGRHFYGGVSLDGENSVWLYPYFNDVAPESPAGLMRVLRSNGETTTVSVVTTPAQLQAPGWGIPAGTGLVCDIGEGLVGFVVTLAGIPEVGSPLLSPFDVTFCTYDPATDEVVVRGEVTQATVGFVDGYPTTAGGIGAVTVVQRRVHESDAPAGTMRSEAVLLWSTNSGSNPPNDGPSFVGTTFISYDSGATWYKISDTVGDFRGAFFLGNDLRPVRPGLAWTTNVEV